KSMVQTARLDSPVVQVKIPQDPGAAGKSLAQHMVKLFAGYPVSAKPVTGDKVTRADPFSSQVNAGNVKLLRGDWNSDFIEELRTFPNGKNDDQVDAAADGFNEIAQGGSFFFV